MWVGTKRVDLQMFPDGLAPSGSDDIRAISLSKQKVPQPGKMASCAEA